ESSGAVVRSYGTELTLAFDRELVPNLAVAALNLTYQPEWTRFLGTGAPEQESTIGAGFGVMARVLPGLFMGGEARYLRKYEGIQNQFLHCVLKPRTAGFVFLCAIYPMIQGCQV